MAWRRRQLDRGGKAIQWMRIPPRRRSIVKAFNEAGCDKAGENYFASRRNGLGLGLNANRSRHGYAWLGTTSTDSRATTTATTTANKLKTKNKPIDDSLGLRPYK